MSGLLLLLHKRRKWLLGAALVPMLSFAGFWVLDWLFPLPPTQKDFAVTVLDRNGEPLRTFADKQGVWRYPVRLDQVSPKYVQALLNYEDRWFYQHPGVNPLALARAAGQRLWHGRFVSGGSTLTMQVARIIDPHSKDFWGKSKQMFRALQLEYHYSKDEILTFYLNTAPFGGTVEGVAAASHRYLGKSPKHLTWSEAALLAVLPQSPSRYRPDKYPEKAFQAKNKVLTRLSEFGVISEALLAQNASEHLPQWLYAKPMNAPLLSRRVVAETQQSVVQTTIDADLQRQVEALLAAQANTLPKHNSIAAMVVNSQTMEVLVYAGSAEFLNQQRYGHVDMASAWRSPGSTLKPFLYGIAMDQGLIHSQSLLADAPYRYDGYAPGNFDGMYRGAVSTQEALQQSLNLPAVQVLHALGPGKFHAALKSAQVPLRLPSGATPSLATILGGTATTLESLMQAYAALNREGRTASLKYQANQQSSERHLLSPQAAWIVRTMLANQPRPGLNPQYLDYNKRRPIAWKTGTSYGFRDAWAVGVTPEYIVGVWVGRPDGTPTVGQYGANTAAPLLFQLADLLPQKNHNFGAAPVGVSQQTICWPLGTLASKQQPEHCHKQLQAWVIDAIAPVTLATPADYRGLLETVYTSPDGNFQTTLACNPSAKAVKKASWPKGLEPWLDSRAQLAWQPGCPKPTSLNNHITLLGYEDNATLKPASGMQKVATKFTPQGAEGQVRWFVNNQLLATTQGLQPWQHEFEKLGRYNLMVVDDFGRYKRLSLNISK